MSPEADAAKKLRELLQSTETRPGLDGKMPGGQLARLAWRAGTVMAKFP
jgi:hypothetical protein